MTCPLVSVIIPVYNGQRFIIDAIKSAMAQSWSELEVVVVDDASTDNTADLITSCFGPELQNDRLRYYRNETNSERSVSRNNGAALARGDYLFFLDYDDLWEPHYVETVMATFALKGSDIVYSFPRTFVDEQGVIIRRAGKRISRDTSELVFGSQVGYPTATAIRANSFPGYAEDCILREDWEIYLRAQLQGQQITVLDNDQIFMRSHSGRTSNSVKFWNSTLIVSDQYREKIPPHYWGIFLYHVADICLRFGDLPRGWRICLQAMVGGTLPNMRMIHRLATRGIRLDRYVTLAAERYKYSTQGKQ